MAVFYSFQRAPSITWLTLPGEKVTNCELIAFEHSTRPNHPSNQPTISSAKSEIRLPSLIDLLIRFESPGICRSVSLENPESWQSSLLMLTLFIQTKFLPCSLTPIGRFLASCQTCCIERISQFSIFSSLPPRLTTISSCVTEYWISVLYLSIVTFKVDNHIHVPYWILEQWKCYILTGTRQVRNNLTWRLWPNLTEIVFPGPLLSLDMSYCPLDRFFQNPGSAKPFGIP